MSTFSDAMRAIRQVVLMQSNVERLQADFERLADDMHGLKDVANDIDKRVVRIEAMIEMAGRAGTSALPRPID